MRGDTDIADMNRTEIEDEIHQWFVEAERELPLPQEWIQRFGKWEQFRSFIDELAAAYDEIQEEKVAADDYRIEADDYRIEAEGKYIALVNQVREIQNDLVDIPDGETCEESSEYWTQGIQAAIKALDKAIYPKVPVVVKKKKRK